jgi:hypothetical protein
MNLRSVMPAILLAVFLIATPFTVSAQTVGVTFGNQFYPVADEYGVLLPGTPGAPGAMLQIMRANQGIFPPATNGTPHPDNPVEGTSFIGLGTDSGANPPLAGIASGSFTFDRFGTTNAIFARFFNSTNLESSSFYVDSLPFDVPVTTNKDFDVTFAVTNPATVTPLDTTDHDQDGIIRSWELSYGSDPNNPDSDGDGMMDGHELAAGTDLNDPSSLLMMVEILPGENGNMEVMWDSVIGKVYQLEYTTNSLVDEVAFVPLNPTVTAAGPMASTVVTNGTVPEKITAFRVRLIVD